MIPQHYTLSLIHDVAEGDLEVKGKQVYIDL